MHKWSKYTSTPSILHTLRVCSYPEYSQYRRTKYCQYLAVPAVQNHDILGVQQCSKVLTPGILRVWEYSGGRISNYCEYSQYPALRNLELLRVLAVPRSTESRTTASTRSTSQHSGPKCCECTKYLQYCLSEILYVTPRYWEYLWSTAKAVRVPVSVIGTQSMTRA